MEVGGGAARRCRRRQHKAASRWGQHGPARKEVAARPVHYDTDTTLCTATRCRAVAVAQRNATAHRQLPAGEVPSQLFLT